MKIRDDFEKTLVTKGKRKRSVWQELLIAFCFVVVLAILSAPFILPSILGHSGQAKVAKAKADLATFRGAIDQFRLDCDRYPTTQEGFDTLRNPPKGLTRWKGPYLSKDMPPDPWGNAYVYSTPGPNGRDGYLVESYGADGAPGGEGDNADIVDGSD